MKINLLICADDDTQLLNETVSSVEEARDLLNEIEYEYDAKLDHVTGGQDE